MLLVFCLVSALPTTSQPDYLSVIIPSVIAIIAAILGALVTYWLTQRQVRRGLIYKVISDTPILGAQKEIEGRIKILFDKSGNQKVMEGTLQKSTVKRPFQNLMGVLNRGSNSREVKDLRLAIIEVQNAGRTPILPGEFLEPLTFSFRGQTEVLDAGIVSAEPNDLKPIIEPTIHNVTLKPLLLNKNDKVKLKILAAGLDDEIEVSARIVGIERIIDYKIVERSRVKRNTLIGRTLFGTGLILLIFSVINLNLSLQTVSTTQQISVSPYILIIFFAATFTISIGVPFFVTLSPTRPSGSS